MLNQLKTLLLGKSKDPMSKDNRHQLALIAFLAWIGLGADGLSSSCYGPELGYRALGSFEHLALYLAILTTITVFLIALSYNQAIELFPNGGGGYKVAKELLGPFSGVVSGSALLIDYTLTIAISIASGADAIFSLLPIQYHAYKIPFEIAAIFFLMYLNIRGMKESIKVLLPIFLGFFISHVIIIIYGIFVHGSDLPKMIHSTVQQTHGAIQMFGFVSMLAILLRAYSLGSGTYTGLEAVSNNVNMLAEPRVKTGKLTMMYMAASLSFVAGGIILLYLLWNVQPEFGKTLNAVVFQQILGTGHINHILLILILFFEAGLLFVGANTGFLGGPAVLANMAQDDWVPRRFGMLSSRLVKQNGVIFFGLFASLVILLTDGSIEISVILYSINVFITFTVSLLGLVVYWWQSRRDHPNWLRRFILSFCGFITCLFILITTVVTKFFHGAWIALLGTALLILFCYYLKHSYSKYDALKDKLDESLELPLPDIPFNTPKPTLDPKQSTAVFLVKDLGGTMHTILWMERMFPMHFKNYIFLSYGVVDTHCFGSDSALKKLELKTNRVLRYLENFALLHHVATLTKSQCGTNPVDGIMAMAKEVDASFSNTVFFAPRYIFYKESLLTRIIHSQIAFTIQRHLQSIGIKMLMVPLNLNV